MSQPTVQPPPVQAPSAVNPFVLVGTALVFIAGLAWNNAMTAIINEYVPVSSGESVRAKVLYAIIITGVAAGIIYMLNKWYSEMAQHLSPYSGGGSSEPEPSIPPIGEASTSIPEGIPSHFYLS